MLIRNSVKFKRIKEVYDREGRYVVIKVKMEGQMVTLINVYEPPDSEMKFFEALFNIIAIEMEAILIVRGTLM